MHRAPALLAALLALAAPGMARAAETELEVRTELGAGLDTNPERTTGARESNEGFAFALVRARGTIAGERSRLAATLVEAGRLYFGTSQATAGASRLDAAARVALGERLSAGASLTASDLTERAHRLDQNGLRADGSLSWDGGGWGASLSGGWSAFAPRAGPLRQFLASGPEAWLRPSFTPAPGHELSAGYGIWDARYPRWPGEAERDDVTQTIAAEYAHRGSFLAALGYAYSWNRSSIPGGNFERHRVTARGAAFLPYRFSLAARATLQGSQYAAPLVSQDIVLAQGRENENALELRLSHPLGESWELAASFATYGGEAGAAVPGYGRTVLSATVGWRGSWRRPRPGRARRRRPPRPGQSRRQGPASFTMGTP